MVNFAGDVDRDEDEAEELDEEESLVRDEG